MYIRTYIYIHTYTHVCVCVCVPAECIVCIWIRAHVIADMWTWPSAYLPLWETQRAEKARCRKPSGVSVPGHSHRQSFPKTVECACVLLPCLGGSCWMAHARTRHSQGLHVVGILPYCHICTTFNVLILRLILMLLGASTLQGGGQSPA